VLRCIAPRIKYRSSYAAYVCTPHSSGFVRLAPRTFYEAAHVLILIVIVCSVIEGVKDKCRRHPI
jgi:hypothetical protein